jgi:hypothetical protein
MKRWLGLFSKRAHHAQDAQLDADGHERTVRMPLEDGGENRDDTRMANSVHSWASSLNSQHNYNDAEQVVASAAWQRVVNVRYGELKNISAGLPLSTLTAVRVGAELWAARSLPRGKPLHVYAGAKLMAVLDTRNHQVGLRNDVVRKELDNLVTTSMPEAAAGRPAGFTDSYLWDVIWQYAMHDPTALMEVPREVAYRPLQMRRLPAVTPSLLEPRHTVLMRFLLKDNFTFEQLVSLTEIPIHELCQDITALVLTRAVRAV